MVTSVPSVGAGRRGWGVPIAHRLVRWLHVSLRRGGSKLGGQALLMTPQGLGRDGEMSPEMPIAPEASPQGLGEIEFAVRALDG
jgi:hypothetical protein